MATLKQLVERLESFAVTLAGNKYGPHAANLAGLKTYVEKLAWRIKVLYDDNCFNQMTSAADQSHTTEGQNAPAASNQFDRLKIQALRESYKQFTLLRTANDSVTDPIKGKADFLGIIGTNYFNHSNNLESFIQLFVDYLRDEGAYQNLFYETEASELLKRYKDSFDEALTTFLDGADLTALTNLQQSLSECLFGNASIADLTQRLDGTKDNDKSDTSTATSSDESTPFSLAELFQIELPAKPSLSDEQSPQVDAVTDNGDGATSIDSVNFGNSSDAVITSSQQSLADYFFKKYNAHAKCIDDILIIHVLCAHARELFEGYFQITYAIDQLINEAYTESVATVQQDIDTRFKALGKKVDASDKNQVVNLFKELTLLMNEALALQIPQKYDLSVKDEAQNNSEVNNASTKEDSDSDDEQTTRVLADTGQLKATYSQFIPKIGALADKICALLYESNANSDEEHNLERTLLRVKDTTNGSTALRAEHDVIVALEAFGEAFRAFQKQYATENKRVFDKSRGIFSLMRDGFRDETATKSVYGFDPVHESFSKQLTELKLAAEHVASDELQHRQRQACLIRPLAFLCHASVLAEISFVEYSEHYSHRILGGVTSLHFALASLFNRGNTFLRECLELSEDSDVPDAMQAPLQLLVEKAQRHHTQRAGIDYQLPWFINMELAEKRIRGASELFKQPLLKEPQPIDSMATKLPNMRVIRLLVGDQTIFLPKLRRLVHDAVLGCSTQSDDSSLRDDLLEQLASHYMHEFSVQTVYEDGKPQYEIALVQGLLPMQVVQSLEKSSYKSLRSGRHCWYARSPVRPLSDSDEQQNSSQETTTETPHSLGGESDLSSARLDKTSGVNLMR